MERAKANKSGLYGQRQTVPLSARYGAGVIPASTTRTARKYPTLFEGNVGIIRDEDDPKNNGDLTIDGVLFCDTFAERRDGNTINIVSEASFTAANINMSERPTTAAARRGQFLSVKGTPFTDSGGGDRGRWSSVEINPSDIRSSGGAAQYGVASTVEINGPPTASNGAALEQARALTISSGGTRLEDPTDADQPGIASLIVDGGIAVGKSVRAGSISLSNAVFTDNKVISLRAAESLAASYSLALPSEPASSDGQTLSVGPEGQMKFVTPPVSTVASGTLLLTGTKVWVGTATSAGGKVVFYPTIDGTPDGNAFMTTVLYAHASPMSDTDAITASAFATRRSTSTDGRMVSFNVLTGAVVDAGGHTIQYAPDGIPVQAVVIGI
jgi:hypothetical protein